MTEMITALQSTPLTTLLVLAGIALIVLALAGGFSGKIEIPAERQRMAGIIGAILLISGVGLYLFNPGETTTDAPEPTAPAATAAADAPTDAPPPTPEPTPEPVEIPAEPIITTVSFENDNRWETGQFNDTALWVNRGQYLMQVLGTDQHAWSFGGYTVDDGTFSLEAALLEGDPTAGYGIIWRADSADDFYLFLVSADGHVRIARCLNQCNERLLFAGNDWFASDAIRQGYDQTNILSVAADGERHRFFINGEEVASGSDTGRQSGRIGVALYTGNGDITTARFDNYTISAESDP